LNFEDVPGYDLCLNPDQGSPFGWCLPNFKPDECFDSSWQNLKTSFKGIYLHQINLESKSKPGAFKLAKIENFKNSVKYSLILLPFICIFSGYTYVHFLCTYLDSYRGRKQLELLIRIFDLALQIQQTIMNLKCHEFIDQFQQVLPACFVFIFFFKSDLIC
jgi:hypothetical protein